MTADRRFRVSALLPRGWFPGALLALGLLGLPGLALLVLHLLGRENAANGWLQDRLGLSYHVTLPLAAALLLALLPLLLLLLYFLKLKRKPLAVPSTFLWRKSIDDVHVNRLFQWLRRNLLLLLQLLTLLVLISALLGPQRHADTATGRFYILLVDNSASMAATDVKPSRLHQAKERALHEIDARSDGDAGMVIVFNARATVLQSYTTDRAPLRRAVKGIEQTQRPTRLDEALLQAAGRANPARGADDQASRPQGEDPSRAGTYVPAEGIAAEVHLFSDGGFPDVADFSLGNLSLHYHPVGRPGAADNVGLVSLSAERDTRDRRRLNVFGRIRNYRSRPASVRVQLEVKVAGILQGLHEQRISGEEEGVVQFHVYDVSEQADVVLHVKLLDVKDDFPLDDEAWLVVGVVRRARVLLVRPTPNPILEAFLAQMAAEKLAAVTLLDAADLRRPEKYRRPALDGAWDLVIFDRCAPKREQDLPFANAFFIDALPPPWQRAKMPSVKDPRVRGWATKHPLMRDLTGLQDIDVGKAFLFDLRARGVPGRPPRLLESDRENALLFALPRRSFTDLVMTFALVNDKGQWNTFWPLKLSFPLFLRNVLFTLGRVGGDETTQPGQAKRLRPDVSVSTIDVLAPEGKSSKLSRGSRPDFAFDKAERVGVYGVRWQGKTQRHFAVNLLDARESDLEPRGAFRVGSEDVRAGRTRKQPHDLWKGLALAALGLLLLEWYISNGRV